jgi:hypothetical protein
MKTAEEIIKEYELFKHEGDGLDETHIYLPNAIEAMEEYAAQFQKDDRAAKTAIMVFEKEIENAALRDVSNNKKRGAYMQGAKWMLGRLGGVLNRSGKVSEAFEKLRDAGMGKAWDNVSCICEQLLRDPCHLNCATHSDNQKAQSLPPESNQVNT